MTATDVNRRGIANRQRRIQKDLAYFCLAMTLEAIFL
jgi:hypothetical protein